MEWPYSLIAVLGFWLLGFLSGLAIRIGREREAELRGIAIGRRRSRYSAPHPVEEVGQPWTW